MKITKITELKGRIYAHVCPVCGKILADACEKEMMPEFSICSCELPEWKYVTFHSFGDGEKITMILHQTAPEFGFTVNSDGSLSDSEENCWESEEQRTEWLNKAAEYISNP